jgi:hypothetical protein
MPQDEFEYHESDLNTMLWVWIPRDGFKYHETDLDTTRWIEYHETDLNTTRRMWIPRDGFEYHETDLNTTRRNNLLIHRHKPKRCDMHVQKTCITKYNAQYNTYARTHVDESLPQNTSTHNTHLLFGLYYAHWWCEHFLQFNVNAILSPHIHVSFHFDHIDICL